MKKITLIKDLPGVPVGTEGIIDSDAFDYLVYNFDADKHYHYDLDYMIRNPDFFRVEDVSKYFEEKYWSVHRHYDMWETLDYIQQLADHLNGDWKYEVYQNYHSIVKFDTVEFEMYASPRAIIKFSPDISFNQFKAKCKPEMLENYIKIMEGRL